MDRDEALRLLRGGKKGVSEWNSRRAGGEPMPVLDGADLIRAVLRAADLSEAVLSGADLRGAELCGAVLRGAVLRAADLCGADLSGADLSKAVLFRADLSGAVLSGAELSGADLKEVDLRGADLSRAVLREADLRAADLFRAELCGAELSGAALSRTDLSRADLRGANVTNCRCHSTLFADVDLSEAKGLETMRHSGPSTVGVETIVKSGGKIPESFLRGCGVPDALIAYLPSLLGAMQPVQFYTCFLSHSSADKGFARRLHSRMHDEGLRVWFDEIDMLSGKKLHEQIDEAIRIHDKVLIVLSSNSMNSEWVKTELRKAFKLERSEGKRKLFPIGLVPYSALRDWECFDADHGKDLAVEVREYFIPDFTNWKDEDAFETAFTKLLQALKAEAK
jgi:hypothetical protein